MAARDRGLHFGRGGLQQLRNPIQLGAQLASQLANRGRDQPGVRGSATFVAAAPGGNGGGGDRSGRVSGKPPGIP